MILSTTDTLNGYRIKGYCGVYHYTSYSCEPQDAINGMEKAFSDDYYNYDDDDLAIIGIKLTQLTDYEEQADDPSYWFVAYGTGVIIEEE